jgi:hypothetical protein
MSRWRSPALDELARIAGDVAVAQLVEEHGGTRIYIPAQAPEGHWLVALVGRAAADKLCAHYMQDGRGTHVVLPLGPHAGRHRQLQRAIAKRIHELDRAGKSASEIARAVRVHMRTVHRHRSAHRSDGDDRQGKLL